MSHTRAAIRRGAPLAFPIAAALVAVLAAGCTAPPAYDLLLTGGTVIDGTGAPRRVADVAIVGDRIVAVAPGLSRARAKRVVDVTGQVVAPGFWDSHAHLVTLPEHPLAENFVRQGITTILAPLHSQAQPFPMDAYRARVRIAPNVGLFAGHTWIRTRVMGLENRAPTAAELRWMRALVDSSMQQGALGLSTGLEYVPAAYAGVDEVAALAEVASRYGGIYVTHLRDEGPGVLDALRETLEVGRRARIPVQVNHLKVTGAAQWGWSGRILALLDSARAAGQAVAVDVYPYTAYSTYSDLMFPPWVLADGAEAFARRVANTATRARLVREMRVRFPQQAGDTPASIQFREVTSDPSLAGKTLADYLSARGRPLTIEAAVEALITLQLAGGFIGIFHGMDERDVEAFLRAPGTMVETDGDLVTFGKGHPHPRSYGSFPRVLARHVRERGVLSLEAAVQRMTSVPAQWLGVRDRGTLAAGQHADVVVLNATTVADRATYVVPHQWPVGVLMVAVNGTVVFEGDAMTGALPGAFLARGRAP
jgi:N-acyl-D-aspartate/D-glutamate deacylase